MGLPRQKVGNADVMIVTGAGRGIGAAVARLASERGYSVAINYAQNESSAPSSSLRPIIYHIRTDAGCDPIPYAWRHLDGSNRTCRPLRLNDPAKSQFDPSAKCRIEVQLYHFKTSDSAVHVFFGYADRLALPRSIVCLPNS